jgi:hypothetical protein
MRTQDRPDRVHADTDAQVSPIPVRPPALAPAAAEMLRLQRTVGNTAVTRLVEQSNRVPDVLRSPGRPLGDPVRGEMEARLDADFSTVRIHDDATARVSAKQIGARAYTSGDHVVLGTGGADKHTLAHELTHVLQQRSGPVAGTEIGDGLRLSHPSDAFERAAEAGATRAMSAPVPEVARRAVDESPSAGTPGLAVQRAIGFEMEVPGAITYAFAPELKDAERSGRKQIVNPITSPEWIRRRDDRPWWRPQINPPSMARRMIKKERLVTVPGLFTVEADETASGSSDLEFVTMPFPENAAGRDLLSEALAGMVQIASRLSGVFRTASDLSAGVAGAMAETPPPPGGYAVAQYVAVGFGDSGNPQVTAGIPLENLVALYSAMETASSQLNDPDEATREAATDLSGQDFRGMMVSSRQRVDTVSNQRVARGEPVSEKLRGLLGLVAAYLVSGETNRNQQYYKGIAPIMARTDLATMFALLSKAERTWLSAQNGAPFVELALECANLGLSTEGQPVLATVAGTSAADRVDFSEVTRQAWLSGLTRGSDLLSQQGYAAAFPQDAGKGEHFESMGSLGAQTDTTHGAAAPIVELRRLRQRLAPTAWEPVLLGIFDLITDIVSNRNNNPAYQRAQTGATASTASSQP